MIAPPATPVRQTGPVLLYDGECGLCNRVVRLLLPLDRRGALRFAPLQGRHGQSYLVSHGLPTADFDTLVFVPAWERRDRREFRLRTDGVISCLRVCGGLGATFAMVLACIPARLRDAGYRVVGHWRYRVFGPWKPRPLKRPEWTARFLD